MRVVVGSTLYFAALVEVVMRHTFDRTSLFLLCSCLCFWVWVCFRLTEVNVFYVIRTTKNYEFDKIKTAGVTGNATKQPGRQSYMSNQK